MLGEPGVKVAIVITECLEFIFSRPPMLLLVVILCSTCSCVVLSLLFK